MKNPAVVLHACHPSNWGALRQIGPWRLSVSLKATLLHLGEAQRQVKTIDLHVGEKRGPVHCVFR